MAEPTLSKIGKYDVVGILGKGGMGVVYKAMDNAIGRPVAIKMMTSGFAENPDLLQRFYREAKSTGTLQHPNIVIVHDLGEHKGNPYLVMFARRKDQHRGEPADAGPGERPARHLQGGGHRAAGRGEVGRGHGLREPAGELLRRVREAQAAGRFRPTLSRAKLAAPRLRLFLLAE